jgi:hypothetical protein
MICAYLTIQLTILVSENNRLSLFAEVGLAFA